VNRVKKYSIIPLYMELDGDSAVMRMEMLSASAGKKRRETAYASVG